MPPFLRKGIPVLEANATSSSSALTRVANHALVPVAGRYEIDPVHTFVSFRAQHLVVGRVRGRFEAMSGSITIAADPMASSLDVTLDAASLTTGHPGRDDDLRSSRFLDVVTFPTLTYRSTTVSPVPPDRWLVEGELVIRGVVRSIPLYVSVGGAVLDSMGRPRVAFHATAMLTRREFGLTTELEKEAGTTFVAHDVTIEIDVEAVATETD